MQSLQIVVIGGGAAGFFGAIACAEAHPHTHITLLEAHQPLSKVRISGGGRCNVTHACFEPATLVQHYPRGGKALRGAFSRFQPRDTVAWFAKHGVVLKTEADGRMFPISDDSGTIMDCLIQTARQQGVQIYTGAPVTSIERNAKGFAVQLKSGQMLTADRLLLATGSSSKGYELAKSLGHSIEPPVPSLFTFTIPDPDLRALAGVAVESVQVRLRFPNQKPLEQTGALLITHWGFSGPAILKLSAWGARVLYNQRYQVTLQVNWLPHYQYESLRQQLFEFKQQQPKRTVVAHSEFELPRRLWQYLVMRAGIASEQRWAEVSKQEIHQLVQELQQGQYSVQGKGVFKDEFVTCGGVRLKEVDFKTMESRLCPGLYFAGEILDIDGVTGGFNFQSAWTTGWLAGQAMGRISYSQAG
ncbi:NAD(P)/FAD-dependent oxidoreductase [Leptolyngbya sp. NK1-12]|uniref:NAD(P)/FAD-dependent oxidoreductase n=1 Tax=Leptolyngbya sp. NK1-12 TaxID=2547451 RepID=A0AA96WDB8_9CYAN|nr:NAD(P)/FAD-dependent oxidoreductase [Leptolyngbya sp. NK1-12]WNZ22855.1 NAD(P)/FAD-dependent oxidoreductase [Leptolyngbya sp. NK1-12]